MGRALSQLIADIDLEKIEINIFRGKTVDAARQQVYGGQVLAQAMNAASRTVATPLVLHSVHAYFLREGSDDIPIVYEVDRIRDGKTFTTRRVVAIQHGRPIFNVSLSYQLAEAGVIEHECMMPQVQGPEQLVNDEIYYTELLGESLQKAWPIEYRQVDPVNPNKLEAKSSTSYVWFKSNGELINDYPLHQELLAYASDHLLLHTALRPHARSPWGGDIKMASLDHAIWFHQPFRIDDWLLYEMESIVASGARAFCRGRVFNRAGHVVASTTQEGLVRVVKE
jgi:acyl-CoA thioesterase II